MGVIFVPCHCIYKSGSYNQLIILLHKRDDVSDKNHYNPFILYNHACIAVVKICTISGFGQLIITEYSINIQLSIHF